MPVNVSEVIRLRQLQERFDVFQARFNSLTGVIDSVNAQTGVVVLNADDISDATTTRKFTTAANLTKLTGIEALADVTDSINVNANLTDAGINGAATTITGKIARTDPGVASAQNGETLGRLSGAPVWLRSSGLVNVENHGVRTTNTAAQNAAALNTLLANIRTGSEPSRRVFLPALYAVDTTILANLNNIEIFGANRGVSGLVQQTANIPALRWNDEGAGDRTSIHVHDLRFGNAIVPTAATSQQYGIQIRSTVDGIGGAGFGYYACCFESLWFDKQYIGIGSWTGTGGICPVWSTEFRRIVGQDIKRSLIYLVSDGNSGQPRLVIADIDVLNYNTVLNDRGTSAIEVKAGAGLSLRDVNIEKWIGNAIYLYGGFGAHLSNMRFEHQDFATAGDSLISLSGGHFTINDTVVSFATVDNGSPQSIFFLFDGANTSAAINGVSLTTIDATPTGTGQLIRAVAGSKVSLSGFVNTIPSVFVEYLPAAWGEGGRLVRTSVDGYPPSIDALPAAAATYRGRLFRVEGAAGVADATYECRKDAANAYAWVAI